MIREWMQKKSDEKLGDKARYDAFVLLKRILQSAANEDDYGQSLLSRNPCKPIKFSRPGNVKEVQIATSEQLDIIYNAMPQHLALTVFLGGIMGLRIGEVCGLSRQNVDLENKMLRVRLQYQKDNITKKYSLSVCKTTASKRDVPIPDKLLPLFSEQLDRFTGFDPDDPLFTTSGKSRNKRTRIAPNILRDTYNRARKSANRDDLCFHHLRHTAGTNIASVADLRTTMSILGHTDMTVALGYQHAVDTRRVEAMHKANNFIPIHQEVQAGSEIDSELAKLENEISELKKMQRLKELKEELLLLKTQS
jgi:integrase